MKFAAFSYYNYYPAGSMYDCVGFFDTMDEAKEAALACGGEFSEVFDWSNRTLWTHDADEGWVVEEHWCSALR